ncbi:MAG: hypothetical protein IKZ45_03535 [Fibrobacter sp.]|nr:hypothetical protein [Fibrobacter sp.]MBR5413344.1 hypothetical protein [Fibrobacter sp.]
MKTLKSFIAVPVLAGFALYLAACNEERPVAKIIVVDQKMPLIEWPDSVYVNSLDSILALEPVKKKDPKENVNLTFNSKKAPVFHLPSSVTGKKEEKKPAKNVSESHGKGLPSGREDNIAGKKAEAFGDRFVRAMSALQSDPNNASLYKMVVANEEDLGKLLRRTYGAGSQTLPLFFVRSALQTVNPGINLDNLNAGDKVKVPKL